MVPKRPCRCCGRALSGPVAQRHPAGAWLALLDNQGIKEFAICQDKVGYPEETQEETAVVDGKEDRLVLNSGLEEVHDQCIMPTRGSRGNSS